MLAKGSPSPVHPVAPTPRTARRIAITIDDPRVNAMPLLEQHERDARILDALASRRLRVALFVCGKRVDSQQGAALLRSWSERGHILGNHSWSHYYFHDPKIELAKYEADFVRAEALLLPYDGFQRVYRFPYLKEGDTPEKRDGMRRALHARGYRTGHVTIDTSDWYIDQRLCERLARQPDADLARYRSFYLEHLVTRAEFYDDLSRAVLGRSVPHTLLIHHNLLTALFLPDALTALVERGFELVDAGEAFADRVFTSEPDIVPAGESLLWALARASHRFGDALRYPGEDGIYEKPRADALGL